jgi:hypothetical protein
MKRLESKKLLTIITSSELEKTIIAVSKKHGVGGYTIVQASGMGASGIQSGMLDVDSNILIYIILSEPRLVRLLDELESLMQRGYRLKAIVQDISILPRKPAGTAPKSAKARA